MQLTAPVLAGLHFLQKYRYLTISQFARVAKLSEYHTRETLRAFERLGFLGFFGFTSLPGAGRTPKVYFLKKKGYDVLASESDGDIEAFVDIHPELAWTPQMYHRLRIIDLFLALELEVKKRESLKIANVFLEYKRV